MLFCEMTDMGFFFFFSFLLCDLEVAFLLFSFFLGCFDFSAISIMDGTSFGIPLI